MRVLVTGAGGQLGIDVQAACTAAGDQVTALDREHLDITDEVQVRAAVAASQPDVVVNCAAWTAVDACEGDPERALLTNGSAVRWMASACADARAHLVQISTDYVFDGTLARPYVETDETNPQSEYGRSKLVGEQAALALGPAATVVRTSWVCGRNGANMVKTVMRLVREGAPLRFVADQVGSPTFTHDLAPLLRTLAIDRLSGIVHATNQQSCSWYEFAQAVVAAMGADPAMVQPIATADLQPPRPAARPANSVLDNAVLRASGYALLRDFHVPLRETVGALA